MGNRFAMLLLIAAAWFWYQGAQAHSTRPDGQGRPDATEPDVYGPDTFGPDTFGPDTFGPDTFGPDTFGPDSRVHLPELTPRLRQELRQAFAGEQAQADARYLAALFSATAERLTVDGQQKTPVLTQRLQIETLVTRLGQLATTGKTSGRYPRLPEVIGKLFQSQFPVEQGPLTSEDRELAIRLFRTLSAGCAEIGGAQS